MAKKAAPRASEQTGIFMRGAKEFRHDLFKSDVQNLKRNVSFKKGVVQIVEIEHAHIFHSHNSQGRPQQFTNSVGGHFHEVTLSTDANGRPVAKCGPAMREVFKKRPGGQRRIKEEIKWVDEVKDRIIVDSHTHTFEYEGSEFLSDRKVKAIQAQTQAAVSDALPEIRAKAEEAHANASDDVSIEEL